MSINILDRLTFDQQPINTLLTLCQHLSWHSNDTPLTHHSIVSWQSTNFQLMHNKILYKSVDSQPTVKLIIMYWLSLDRLLIRYWSRLLIDTWPWMPLVHVCTWSIQQFQVLNIINTKPKKGHQLIELVVKMTWQLQVHVTQLWPMRTLTCTCYLEQLSVMSIFDICIIHLFRNPRACKSWKMTCAERQ